MRRRQFSRIPLAVTSDGRSEYKSRDKKKFEFVDAFFGMLKP
jgi:hypothetical protein